jgi:hypothetical protein
MTDCWKLLIAAAVSVVPSVGFAGINVEYKSTVGGTWTATGSGVTISGNDVALASPAAGYWRIYTDNPATEPIGEIRCTGSGSNTIVLIIGKHATAASEVDDTTLLTTHGCQDLKSVTEGSSSTTIRLKARVGRDLGPTTSTIDVTQINRLDIERNIIRPRINHRSTTDVCTAITAGGQITDLVSVSAPSVNDSFIESAGGEIANVVAEGNLVPPIRVLNDGRLGRVESKQGDVGSARPANSQPSDTGGYQATEITAGSIGRIIGESIRSNITATTGVHLIRSTVDGLRGNLNTPTLLNESSTGGLIYSKAQCNMEMTFTDELPSDAMIVIGTSYGYDNSTGTGSLPPYQPKIRFTNGAGPSLAGQIVFNWNKTTYPLSLPADSQVLRAPLLGSVEIGASSPTVITYGSEWYPETSSDLGGGWVGVAGYGIHLEDSSPAYNRGTTGFPQYTSSGLNAASIELAWYGPVTFASGPSPFAVLWTDTDSFLTATAIADATVRFAATAHSTDPHRVILTAVPSESMDDTFCRGFYHIMPVTSIGVSGLNPLLVDGSAYSGPANFPVANDEYIVEVTDGEPCSGFGRRGGGEGPSVCMADADCDGDVTSADIGAYATMYFAGVTTTGSCAGQTADENGDGVVDTSDLFAFVNAWLNGCGSGE